MSVYYLSNIDYLNTPLMGPSWRPYLGVVSLFSLPLPGFGLFGWSLNLISLRGKGLPNFYHFFSLLAPSSFLGQLVRDGAKHVEEWEILNELSCQGHPSRVDSLSVPTN